MNRIFTVFLAAVSLITISEPLFGQSPSVDPLTGKLNMSVPLYNLPLEGKNFPIAAFYSAGGIRAGETGGFTGLGWGLSITGNISRVVKDLPDDYEDETPDHRQGWLKGSLAEDIQSFEAGNSSWAALDAFRYKDTQPDEFMINFGSIDGKFVFDENGKPHIYPYQDLVVEAYDEKGIPFCSNGVCNYSSPITSFKITDKEGFVYTFAAPSITTKTTSPSGDDLSTGKIYGRELEMYREGVSYNSIWYLTQITSPAGEFIKFTYSESANVRKSMTSAYDRSYYIKKSGVNETGYLGRIAHSVTEVFYPKHLSEIKVYNQGEEAYTERILFISKPVPQLEPYSIPTKSNFPKYSISLSAGKTNNQLTNIQIYRKSIIPRKQEILINDYKFNYYNSVSNDVYFLKSITEVKASRSLPVPVYEYYFIGTRLDSVYVDGSEADAWGYFDNNNRQEDASLSGETFVALPPELHLNIDKPAPYQYNFNEDSYVGFFKHLAGDRKNINSMGFYGALKGIKYPDGAYTLVKYEPNSYFDAGTQETENGPGVRVDSVLFYENLKDIEVPIEELPYKLRVKEYVYEDNAGKSTGRAINKPQYAYKTNYYQDPVTGEKESFKGRREFFNEESVELVEAWDSLTLRTPFDLNEENYSYVLYSHVKEKTAGNGWVEYNYSIPVYYGIDSVKDYRATKTSYFSTTFEFLAILGSTSGYVFPYPPNPDYSFENGLLQNIKTYREDGQLLNETIYNYQRLNKANKKLVKGLKVHHVRGFSTYQESSTNHEENFIYAASPYFTITGVTNVPYQIEERTYDEAGTGNYLSQVQRFNYDDRLNLLRSVEKVKGGITYITEYKYPEDYENADTSTGDVASKAIWLMKDRHIKTPVIESMSKVKYSDGRIKTLGAGLTTYSQFGTYILPAASYVMSEIQAGELQESYVNTNGEFIFADAQYEKQGTLEDFNNGSLLTGKDRFGNYTGTHYNNDGQPIAQISNARASQLIYSGFESKGSYDFTTTEAPSYAEGYTGQHSIVIGDRKLIRENYTRYGETAFELRLWGRSAAAATITVTIKDNANHVVAQSQSLSGPDKWQELNWSFDLSGSSFTENVQVEISSSQEVWLDNVSFKPQSAYLSTLTYNAAGQVTATTGNNGRSAFNEYDAFGRLALLKDQDKNILKSYQYSQVKADELIADFEIQGPLTFSTTVTFIAKEQDHSGLRYFWKIGRAPEYEGASSETLVFEESGKYFYSPGYYKISLRVEHPELGSRTSTKKVKVH